MTGGTGFLGSHLATALAATGWEVHLLARRKASGVSVPLSGGMRVHVYTGETSGVIAAMGASQPDVVFHLASLFITQHAPEQISDLIDANVLLGTQLLEAMRLTGTRALVNTGTPWQRFDGPEFCPVNLYAATKQAFEDVIAYYVAVVGVRSITLSLSDTYGQGDTRKKLFSLLLQALNSNELLAMSPGNQVLDMVHASDVCEAFLRAAEIVREPGRPMATTYAVSGGERRTLREVVEVFEKAAGRRLRIKWGARPYRQREVMVPWDGPRLPEWSPKVRLLDGFTELLGEKVGCVLP